MVINANMHMVQQKFFFKITKTYKYNLVYSFNQTNNINKLMKQIKLNLKFNNKSYTNKKFNKISILYKKNNTFIISPYL